MTIQEINAGTICPYCYEPSEVIDSAEIYGKSYGTLRICKPCGAWVGTHKESGEALGRLANKELRELKVRAHSSFDRIWKGKHKSRRQAYLWLAHKMDIPPHVAHIGMFNEKECRKAIEICEDFLPRPPIKITFDNI